MKSNTKYKYEIEISIPFMVSLVFMCRHERTNLFYMQIIDNKKTPMSNDAPQYRCYTNDIIWDMCFF